jgi:hypothetical protein
MQTIKGGCHCGNIRFVLEWPLDDHQLSVRACSCSFCRAHVAEYVSHRDARLAVTVDDGSRVSKYRFATETADFLVCSRCGVVPLVLSSIEGRLYAVVNVNACADLAAFRLTTTITDFDGEDPSARLRRRQQSWIPEVEIRGLEAC